MLTSGPRASPSSTATRGAGRSRAATLPGAQVPLWDSERFATEVTFEKQAVDPRSRKSGVEASVKNPEPTEPLVAFAGLRPRGEPTFGGPPATAAAPAVCPSGPGPDAGTLELSRPHYVMDETVGTPFVLVTRTGGSTGAVSASVITSDGSAAAGADYRAVSTTVRFENGDTSPRLVQIPIFRDAVPENAETFDVSLLDPNCVVFGAQTTAGVTIADVPEGDRRLRPPETRPAPQSIPFASRVRCLVALRACRRRTALGPGLLAAGPASD